MGIKQEDARMNGKASFMGPLRLVMATTVFCLAILSATAQTNVRVRVMASNLTGNPQTYQTPQLNILKGLKPDVIAMQEFQYTSATYGANTPAAFREMIDDAFGTNFFYYRESGYTLPNGIVSRYPIISTTNPLYSITGWGSISRPTNMITAFL